MILGLQSVTTVAVVGSMTTLTRTEVVYSMLLLHQMPNSLNAS